MAVKSSSPEPRRAERGRPKADFLQELQSLQAIAKEHNDIPGYKAATCIQLGFPVYKMDASVALAFKKRIPTVDEMILRLVELNIDHSTDMSSFLGVDHSLIEDHASRLSDMEQIRRMNGIDGKGPRYELMEAGKSLVKQLEFIQQQTETWTIYIDGFSRKICGLNRGGVAARTIVAKTCKDRGIEMLDPVDSDFPKAHEIDIAQLEKQINSSGRGRRSNSGIAKNVQCITELMNYQTRFIPFYVVVYEPDVAGEPIFKSISKPQSIEGLDDFLNQKWWPAYKMIFQSNSIPAAHEVDIVASISGSAVPETRHLLEAETRVRDIEVLLAKKETESPTDVLRRAEIEDLKKELSAAKLIAATALEAQQRAEAEAASLKLNGKVVEWNEHSGFLADALDNARKRLLIVSPWMKRRVVDDHFFYRVKRLLGNGVIVRVLYGMPTEGRKDPQTSDPAAIDDLLDLYKEGDMKIADLSCLDGTHEKILIKDDDFFIATSHNWLSYDGKKSQRREKGVLVTDKKTIDDQWNIFEKTLQLAISKSPVKPPTQASQSQRPLAQAPPRSTAHGKFPKR